MTNISDLSTHNYFTHNYQNAADFLTIFARLLVCEKFDIDETDISFLFEVVASHLLIQNKVYFDGAASLSAKIRKARQIKFVGKMWVGGDETQWLEAFNAMVTDKRITKQGIWFQIRVGEMEAEGDLSQAFDLPEDDERDLYEKFEEMLNAKSAQ